MTQDALLQAVRENPGDGSLRLVYADWLEDHGQPERAEFIRVLCELARLPDDPRSVVRRRELEARERALLREQPPPSRRQRASDRASIDSD